MIDFAKIKCKIGSGASVGIGVDPDEPDTFFMPIAYFSQDKTASLSAEQKKDAFFELYRLFNEYVRKNKLDEAKDLKSSNPGGVYAKKDGYTVELKDEENETLLFTKVNFINSILDAFDPYAIRNIANRKVYSDQFQFEDALNHLDDAIFLKNGSFIVEEAQVSGTQVLIEPTELAQMFCFIYLDLQTQLKQQEQVDAQYYYLAERFTELHLFPQASLFNGDTFESVKSVLKHRLEIIDNNTALKDDDYTKLHDAVHAFLYGDPIKGFENTFWGIKDFHPIWEDLCFDVAINGLSINLHLTCYRADTEALKVVFADTQRVNSGGSGLSFSIDFEKKEKKLRPDLVLEFLLPFTEDFPDKKSLENKRISSPCYWNEDDLFRDSLIDYYNLTVTEYGNNSNRNPKIGGSELASDLRRIYGKPSVDCVGRVRFLIDFKYKIMSGDFKSDIIKQVFYAHCLGEISFSQFWLPCAESLPTDKSVTPCSGYSNAPPCADATPFADKNGLKCYDSKCFFNEYHLYDDEGNPLGNSNEFVKDGRKSIKMIFLNMRYLVRQYVDGR